MLIETINNTLLILFLFQSCNMFGINKNANKPIPRDIGKNSSIYLRIKLHEYFKSMASTKAPDNIVENTIASIRKRKPAILFEPGLLYLQWNLFLFPRRLQMIPPDRIK